MIKAIKSILELVDFSMMESSIALSPPPNEEISMKDIIEEYDVTVDFMIKEAPDNIFIIFGKVTVNENGVLPGYEIFAQGVCTYKINGELDPNVTTEYLYSSAVPHTFNNLRAFISSATSFYALGTYNLPIFNLANLLEAKKSVLTKSKKVAPKKAGIKKKSPTKSKN